MAQELFFTSAERGLQVGSRGYCTVARTAKMRRGLVARLEEISAFRPHFSANDPRANENPVVVSHVRVTADGQPVTVLSRIASAAPDYSGRTNYLAHHVVVDPSERSQAGPVWTAMQANVLARSWDGQVREIPTTRAMPHGNTTAGICHAWERMTRDAGWGGVLAEHLANKTTQPFYLVYEPGQDLLPLLAEAVALLPPSRRWDVTFSTYYTGARGNMSCAVRGVVRGSEEAALARGSAHLDLANLGGLGGRTPPDSMWVEAARTGVAIGTLATPAMSGAPRILGGLAGPGIEPPNVTGRGRPPVQAPAELPTPASRAYVDDDDDLVPPPPPSSGSKWIWITSGIALGLLILAGGIALVMNLDGLKGEQKQVAQNQEKPKDTPPKANPENKQKEQPPEPEKDKQKKPGGAGAGTARVGDPLPDATKKPSPSGGAETGTVTLPDPPADPAALQKTIDEMKKQLEDMKKAKEEAEKGKAAADTAKAAAEAAKVKAESALNEAQAKLVKFDDGTWLEARKGESVQLSKADKEHKTQTPIQGQPSSILLLPRQGASTDIKKITALENHVFQASDFKEYPNGIYEMVIKVRPEPDKAGGDHWFTIRVQVAQSVPGKPTSFTISARGSTAKKIEEGERPDVLKYLTQNYRLVIVERGNRRLTVCDLVEGD